MLAFMLVLSVVMREVVQRLIESPGSFINVDDDNRPLLTVATRLSK